MRHFYVILCTTNNMEKRYYCELVNSLYTTPLSQFPNLTTKTCSMVTEYWNGNQCYVVFQFHYSNEYEGKKEYRKWENRWRKHPHFTLRIGEYGRTNCYN